LFAKHDCCDELYWTDDLIFYVHCNDLFFWGSVDVENIETDDNITLLMECLRQSKNNALLLYCARKRGMRPQGAYYKYLFKEEDLFDNCGPERELWEPGNTPKPGRS